MKKRRNKIEESAQGFWQVSRSFRARQNNMGLSEGYDILHKAKEHLTMGRGNIWRRIDELTQDIINNNREAK